MEEPKTPFEQPDFPGRRQSAGNEPSSATGIFGQIPTAPDLPEDDLLASLLKQPAPPAPTPAPSAATADSGQPAAGPVVAASTSPGEFTRMLQALNLSEPAASAGPPVVERPSEELAKAFSHIALEKIPSSEPAAKRENPSSGQGASSSPSGFTQMFKAVSDAPAGPAKGQMQTTPEQPQSAPPPIAPGEFTKIFQGIKEESEPPKVAVPSATPERAPQSGPGAFTRMFSNQGASPSPQDDPLKSLKPEVPPESGLKFTGGAAPSADPALPAQGGFTQLLRALNQEAPQKNAEPPVFQASPTPAAPPPSTGGGFTQLLRALSPEPASAPAASPSMSEPSFPSGVATSPPSPPFASRSVVPPVLPPAEATPPPPAAGPGEFTRVISGSALRELQGQGSAPVPPKVSAPAAQPGWSPPSMPQAPTPPPPPPAQHFAPQAFAFPPAPAPPPVAAPTPSQSALQKYMPLILVLNVFLMLAIVIILVFALHHK